MVQKYGLWPTTAFILTGLVLSLSYSQIDSPGKTDAALISQRVGDFSLKTPLYFEANQGQLADDVSHMAAGKGYRIAFSGPDALIQLSNQKTKASASIHMSFAGAENSQPLGSLDKREGVVHRYLGREKSRQFTNIPTYKKLKAPNLYPGIDLVYYGRQRELEYDFVVKPGANPEDIRLSFDGVKKLYANENGDLVLDTGNGELVQKAPVTYQVIDGARQTVASSYKLDPDNKFQVAFNVADYDHTRTLVIDPIISYSSYLGTAEDEWGTGIGVDASGNIYVSLDTYIGPPAKLYTVTVKKFSAAGTELYSTEVMSDGAITETSGIAVGTTGELAITGRTATQASPLAVTPNALQSTHDGVGYYDGFVVALDAAGAILYASYLGGNYHDMVRSIAIGGTNIFLTGVTKSSNFPLSISPYDSDCGDESTTQGCWDTDIDDGFFTVIDPGAATGPTSLVYSTYFGGTTQEIPNAIHVSPTGLAAIGGWTSSSDFPTVNPYNTSKTGAGDGFVAVFDHTQAGAAGLVYSTFIGSSSGTVNEEIDGVVHDGTYIYVTGYTDGTDFPTTASAYATTNAGLIDVFVSKLDPAQTSAAQLVYSTYLGGTGDDRPASDGRPVGGWNNPIGVYQNSGDDMVVIGGNTPSADWPLAGVPHQAALASASDGYITILNTSVSGASSVYYSSYIGGNSADYIADVFVLADGTSFFTGNTASTTLYTTIDATQPVPAGGFESFVTKLSPASTGADASVNLGASANPVGAGTSFDYVMTVSNAGPDAADITLDIALDASMTITGITIDALPPTTECSNDANTAQCIWSTGTTGQMAASSSHNVVITTTAGATGTYTATAVVSTGATTDPDTSNNTALYDIDVTAASDISIGIVPVVTSVNVGTPAIYNLTVSNAGPSNATGVSVSVPIPANTTFDAGNSDPGCSGSTTITCSVADITSGFSSADVPISFIPDSNAVGLLSVTPTASSANFDPVSADNTTTDSSVTVNAVTTDLEVTSITPSVTTMNVGEIVTYTVSITELSGVAASNVTITNVLPANTVFDPVASSAQCAEAPAGTVTCNLGSIPASGNALTNIAIKPLAAAVGALNNSVSVSSTEADGNAADNILASIGVTVNPVANLGVNIAPPSANPVVANSNTVIPVNVNNAGPNTATGITVVHTLLAGTAFDGGNSSPGCIYTAPDVTCTLANITAGGNSTVNISIIPSNANAPSISPVFSVSAAEADTNITDNSDSIAITVNTAPALVDLGITVAAAVPDPVLVNGSTVFPITLSNTGPDTASTVKVTHVLGNATFDAANSSAGCTVSAGFVECLVGTVTVGATPAVNIALIPNAAAVPSLAATFDVSSSDTDSNVGNNSAIGSVTVNPAANISVSQTAPLSAGINSTVTYTLTVTNHGPSPATAINVNDILQDPGVTGSEIIGGVVNSGNPADTCASVTLTEKNCSISSLASGASVTIDITVSTGSPSGNNIINQVAITALAETDPDATNDASSATTTLYDVLCGESKSVGVLTRDSSCVVGVSTSSITGGGGSNGILWLMTMMLLHGLRKKLVTE